MNNTLEKGTAKTGLIALAILIIFIVLGAIVYRSDSKDTILPNSTTTPAYTLNTGTSTTSTSTVTTVYTPTTTRTVAVISSPFPGGVVYHNSTYGLTVGLPTTWNNYRVTIGQDSFAGVSNTASIYINGGTSPLTINVFTKEQWNDIRIQETNSQINSFGEGDYLGENKNYIFSSIGSGPDIQSILDRVRFY